MIGLTAQQVRQIKQQYLRQNISEQLYQDFGEFCQQQTGTINIDLWTPKFIQELVSKFKKQRQIQNNQNNPAQRSFFQYQSGNSDQIKQVYANIQKSLHNNTDSILQQLNEHKSFSKNNHYQNISPSNNAKNSSSAKQTQKVPKINNQKQKQKQKAAVDAKQKKQLKPEFKSKPYQRSAVDLLDSVFQKSNTSKNITAANFLNNQNKTINKKQVPNENNFKTQSINNNSAFFDSVNFWAVPTSGDSPDKNSRKQQKKEQKFSQSSSTFSNLEYDPFGDFLKNSQQGNKKSNDKSKNNWAIINAQNTKPNPNFENLNHLNTEKIQQKNKKVSPYIKKQKAKESPQPVSSTQLEQTQTIKSKKQIKIKQIKMIEKQQQQEIQNKKKKIPYQGSKVLKQQFEDQIKCHKSTIRNILADPDLTVVIHKHQIISRSFFMADYAMYTLRILPADIQCKRNFQDFTKLRNALQRVYPGIHLPYLQKKGWLSQISADFIKKQKNMLQFFLADIIQNKQLRNSRIFEDFLSLKQHKKMKRKFQEYDKMQKLNGLQQLCLLDGKIDIKLKSDQIIYEQKVSKYISKIEQYLQKQRKLSQTLSSQYQGILDTINSLSQVSKLISKQTKDFNSRVTINEISNLQYAFQVIQSCYKESYNQNKFQLDLLNKKIIPFLQYQKYNLQPLKDLINTRNILTRRYLKRIQTQSTNSNISYDNDKLKVYKNGILQQSKNIIVFKYQVGFLNNQVCQESKRIFQLMSTKFKKKWDYIAKKHMDRITQSDTFWKDVRGIKQY